jgi:transcriptional regulator with XRE-family HTH domain
MSKLKRDIGERFSTLRGQRSYRAFAEDTKISESLLQRYETGGGLPSTENIVALAKREKIHTDWLLMGKGPMRA